MLGFKSIIERLVILFIIGFIVTFPFNFFIFPDLGTFLSSYFIEANRFIGNALGVSIDSEFSIISDSTGLYLHLITLTIFSSIIALFWFLKKKKIHPNVIKYFRIGIAYYLALILFKYGIDKVFKHQFYFPEPNTLFTPLHQLSKDILFWSSMGASNMYSMFSGLIELLPAVLLLFKKTRLLGGVIAFAVLVNVVMLNFGFDISVKVFSLFLLLLSVVIIWPDMKRVYQLFTNSVVENSVAETMFRSKNELIKYAFLKSVVVGLIIFESIGPYVETQNFNDDSFAKPYLYGAYTVMNSNDLKIKRVFFHRKQYFIIQYENDKFESFKLEFSKDKQSISVIDESDPTVYYQFSLDLKNGNLDIEGKFKKHTLFIHTFKENLKWKEISKGSFNWTVDSYIE